MLTDAGAAGDAAPRRGAEPWRARLTLGFARNRGASKTWLVRRDHVGPLQVQRCFHPETNGCCHAYVIHPPGGLAGGDELLLEVAVDEDAAALLTTPAATKLYRAREGFGLAVQEQRLHVASGAVLEWLPQETILFRGARARLSTRVDLAPGACFLGWEVVCLGRPASRERFEVGQLVQHLEVWRAAELAASRPAEPLFIDRVALEGGDELDAPFGLHGHDTYGTFVCVGPDPGGEPADERAADELLQALRELAGPAPRGRDAWTTVSRVGRVWVLRYLGGSAPAARSFFGHAWALLRPALSGRAACAPRIWAT